MQHQRPHRRHLRGGYARPSDRSEPFGVFIECVAEHCDSSGGVADERDVRLLAAGCAGNRCRLPGRCGEYPGNAPARTRESFCRLSAPGYELAELPPGVNRNGGPANRDYVDVGGGYATHGAEGVLEHSSAPASPEETNTAMPSLASVANSTGSNPLPAES